MMKITHTNAKRLIELGLFKGLTSFDEFVERSNKLKEDPKNSTLAGDYLEVLVEALLYTHPEFQAKKVWQVGFIPAEIADKYRFPLYDTIGLDGAYEDETGEIIPYQVKSYAGSSLAYGKVSEFIGHCKNVKTGLIFTTTEGVSKRILRVGGIKAICLGWFKSLTTEDFSRVRQILRNKPSIFRRATPRKNQNESTAAVIDHYKKGEKLAQLTKTCGSGKTLIGIMIGERIREFAPNTQHPPVVVVFVPSISLAAQTRKAWKYELNGNIVEMVVCSDSKAGTSNEEFDVSPDEVPFPTNTDPATVRAFLKHKTNKTKVIFCTYQSSHIIREGMKYSGVKEITLAIFDEAHRTTSTDERASFPLHNKNIPIAFRLFMTATPKHYKFDTAAQGGGVSLRHSMDDKSIYGEVVYNYTPAMGVRDKVTLPIELVVVTLTRDDLDREMLKRGVTKIKSNTKHSVWMNSGDAARRIGLDLVIRKFGPKHILSFNKNCKHSKEFAYSEDHGIKNFLTNKKFVTTHVDGTMNTKQRNHIFETFANAEYGILSNVQVAGEGVDIPTIDAVDFQSARRSFVNIVQASGRAARKAPGKTRGLLIAYLFVEAGESHEAAFMSTNNNMLREIMTSMMDMDADMVERIRVMRQEMGKSKVYNQRQQTGNPLPIHFVSPSISESKLRKALMPVIIRKLSSSWDEMFGELSAFINKHGRLPTQQEAGSERVGAWINHQRRFKNRLTPNQIAALSSLPCWSWGPIEDAWFRWHHLALIYGSVTRAFKTPEGDRLGKWIFKQRHTYKSNQGSGDYLEKRALIECIPNWTWDSREQYLREVSYKNIEKTLTLTKKYGLVTKRNGVVEKFNLGHWQAKVREKFNDRTLTREFIGGFESIPGWKWKLDAWAIRRNAA